MDYFSPSVRCNRCSLYDNRPLLALSLVQSGGNIRSNGGELSQKAFFLGYSKTTSG